MPTVHAAEIKMWNRLPVAAPILLAVSSACSVGRNYGPTGPYYSGSPTAIFQASAYIPDTIGIASFNSEFAKHIDRAVNVVSANLPLRNADIILLQEMDAAGTREIAAALGMFYAYYPATVSALTKRDFGNAILSRWPIVEPLKIVLPYPARLLRTKRTATAATVLIGSDSVRVYSVHLGTAVDCSPEARRQQLRAVIADAARYRRVIIGGDMNSYGVGRVAREHGYRWPTEFGPATLLWWRWDHIFVRGFSIPDGMASGTVRNKRGASDHRPVWARVVIGRLFTI